MFRKAEDVWIVSYRGEAIRLRDARGMSYIRMLLRHPGCEFHCLDLAVQTAGPRGRADQEMSLAGTDAGAVLDERAVRAYRRRVRDLQEDIDEARAFADDERAACAEQEIEAIGAELSAALGLGGRPRRGADTAERARKAVTNRIRASLQKIAEEHPELGQHLRDAIQTGTYCSYTPDQPAGWQV